jgi:hypothetical protein
MVKLIKTNAFCWSSLFFILISINTTNALVSVGGYVPFGPSTQKSVTGGKNTFSFDPMLSLNTIITTPFYNQLFLPEIGMVFHGEGQDGYSKRTTLFIFDMGHRLTGTTLLRYGLGTFLTRITADGGSVTLPNGSDTATYYQPNEASTSWNTTVNLGLENSFGLNYAGRVQTYLFSLFNGEARKVSYSLSLVYYL